MKKAILAAAILGAAVLTVNPFAAPNPVFAAEQTATAEAAVPQLTYTYTSKNYGYTIQCPQKPVGVIPASELYPDKKGEVLIFDNDGYDIKKAWVIITDAFEESKVPDLNKLTEPEAETLLKGIFETNAYESIMTVNLTPTNRGIYAVTAKTVDIDTDGDGKADVTATADTQMAITFFRGEKGGRYQIMLIDNPNLLVQDVALSQRGVVSFQETK